MAGKTNYREMMRSLGKTKPIIDHLLANGFSRETKRSLYVVQVLPPHGRVKIGRASVPVLRWTQLMADWYELPPLRPIVFIEGAMDLERQLQECFSFCQHHGEWFDYDPLFEQLVTISNPAELVEWMSRRTTAPQVGVGVDLLLGATKLAPSSE